MSLGVGGHARQTANKGIHSPISWTFADAAARTAFTVTDGAPALAAQLTAEDLFKIGLQLDNNTTWLLTGLGPETWAPFASLPIVLSGATPQVVSSSTGVPGSTGDAADAGHTHQLTFSVLNAVLATASATLDVNGHRITNLGTPTAATDAATKQYVDSLAAGLDPVQSCLAVATSNIASLTGLAQTVDGVALNTLGMRVLLTAQSTATQNGVWTVASGAWARPSDFNTGEGAAGAFTFIEQGTLYSDTGWVCTTDSPNDVVGTNNLAFVQFSGAGMLTAGAGLTKTGNTLDVGANADGSITVNANDIQVGILATDAQHGTRGGGSIHALVIAAGAAGFMSGTDKTKLDGIAASAAAVSSTAPVDVTRAAASAGAAATAARQDHKHDVAVAAPASGAVAVGNSTSAGSSSSLATADHQHSVARGTPVNIGTANSGGSGVDFAAGDHVHALPFSTVNTVLGTASASVGFNAQRLTGVADPTGAQDVATKAYVDALAAGLDPKASVRALAVANVATMTGLAQTVDGVALNTIGYRVALTAQTTGSQNGIWVVASGAWTRATDMAAGASAAGASFWVEQGTTYADTGWVCISDVGSDVVGTSTLSFSQFSGLGSITAGAGLTKTGNTLNVVANADGSITVNADDIQVGILATDAQHGTRGGGSIHAVATTSTAGFQSAADKDLEDRVVRGVKEPVRAATTGNITLSGAQTIDGVSIIATDRVLVRAQTTGSQNGIYVCAAGAWSRATDFDADTEVRGGTFIVVQEGTVFGQYRFWLSNTGTITIGTTALTFNGASDIIEDFIFDAQNLLSPNSANWTINAFAPLSADSTNAALSVRRFDDATTEGVGFGFTIPPNAVALTFKFITRAQTAPGGTVGAVMGLYTRSVPDNAAVTAWSSVTLLTTLSIPNNANFQYDQQTLTLATLGLTAGNYVQFELVRVGANGSDTLTGDLCLLRVAIEAT